MIIIMVAISLLFIYMSFLLCLDPLMNQNTNQQQQQQQHQMQLDNQNIMKDKLMKKFNVIIQHKNVYLVNQLQVVYKIIDNVHQLF